MEKFKALSIDQKIEQLKEDYQNEWWKPSRIDDYDLKKKVILYWFKNRNILVERNFFKFFKILFNKLLIISLISY